MSSIFTKIVNREIPAHIVYEDDVVLAFLDINPSSKGHTLVISKQETDHVDELPDDTYNHLMKVVKQLSLRLKKLYRPIRVGMMVFGTEVPHAHVHLIPLYTGQEMTLVRGSDNQDPDHDALAAIASEIKTD